MVQANSVHEDISSKELKVPFTQEREDSTVRSPSISRDEVLVIAKKSRLERDLEKKGLSQEELLAHYETMGEGGARILAGHLHNLDSIATCKKYLPEQQVVHLDDLKSFEALSRYKVVIALGGDDFFKLIGHYIGGETCIIGVKSDPASRGALLPFEAEQVPDLLKALEQGSYKVERWTRPRLYVNGKDCGTATNEIVTGKGDFRLMSRHILDYRGESVTQQSSGILISNGAGSTGWYSSAGLYLGRHDRSFSKVSQQLRFELREPSVRIEEREGQREVILPPHVEGSVGPGEILRITSLNDDDGIISRDSLDAIPFPRGSVAEITIDSEPLRVIVP
jgi:NAD kinase